MKRPSNAVQIGRNTIFGNPVRIGAVCPVCKGFHNDAGSTGPCYRRYLNARLADDEAQQNWALKIARNIRRMPIEDGFRDAVKGLSEKSLFCPGCGTDSPTCHGRILEEAIASLNEE